MEKMTTEQGARVDQLLRRLEAVLAAREAWRRAERRLAAEVERLPTLRT